MRLPLVLSALLLVSATLLVAPPASASPDCWHDPVTGQSPCDWTCGGSWCPVLAIVLFPCEHPGIRCP